MNRFLVAFVPSLAFMALSSCRGNTQDAVVVEDSLKIDEVATLDESAETPIMLKLDKLAENLALGTETEVCNALAAVQAELQAMAEKGDTASVMRYSAEVGSFLEKNAEGLKDKKADTGAITALLHGTDSLFNQRGR